MGPSSTTTPGSSGRSRATTAAFHDKDNTYTWTTAFTGHVAGLNTASFAGHTDWRLPNVKELQSIVNYQNSDPSVSPAFNTGCTAGATVLTGSCTAASVYWSSTTFASNPASAWVVFFFNGVVSASGKNLPLHVRAVRGGL